MNRSQHALLRKAEAIYKRRGYISLDIAAALIERGMDVERLESRWDREGSL